ncbi:hypothetical protein [Enterobacter bugandensis]|uniref:hypothetical protein n=1 Tax=Enterobacter bugandensis TaxID=881260 RepID=UPI0020053CDB|nr:hypothetical protein [Enterobacter bugandensis]MCK7435895.1 hypothetical protein [Enterobacter bugandensis]
MATIPNGDLLEKLTMLERKLLREFIKEADPDNWVGRRQTLHEIGEKQKNLRLLDKNNAKGTYAVLKAVQERRKDLMAPLKKGQVYTDVVDENQMINELNEQAAQHFKHLQTIN